MARRNKNPIGSTVNYAPKTSEEGFYSPDENWQFGGTNRDGSEWNTTWMKWNKAPTPQAAPAPAPTPAPKAAPKPAPKKPVEHSPEIKQAKERVKTYENDILSGKTSDKIYDVGSNAKDYGKESYINRDYKGFNQIDLGGKTFDGTAEHSKQNSQDFLSTKKSELTSSSEYKQLMQ